MYENIKGLAMKANFTTSALIAQDNQGLSPEARAAAGGLLEVHGVTE